MLSSSLDFQLKEDKSHSHRPKLEEAEQERLPLGFSDQHSQGVSCLSIQAPYFPASASSWGVSREKAAAFLVFSAHGHMAASVVISDVHMKTVSLPRCNADPFCKESSLAVRWG